MGGLFSKFRSKRKLDNDSDDDDDIPLAKRIRLNSEPTEGRTTIGYDYLFQQGRDSDIDVVINKKKWKLHKSFLKQSPYFQSLADSSVTIFTCSISDPNVDQASLELCFGYMYGKPLDFIDEHNVTNVLATAKFLQLSDIIEKVSAFLIQNVDTKNAVKYFYLAEKHLLHEVCHYIYQRLLLTLVPTFKFLETSNQTEFFEFLRNLRMDVLIKLIKDPEIVLVKDEYDLYHLLKIWVTALTVDSPEKMTDKHIFETEKGKSFLESSKGKRFADVFKCLNYRNLFVTSRYYDMLKSDNIVPSPWLRTALSGAWKTHVTYFDYTEVHECVDVNIPLQERVKIIADEKYFQDQSNRIFKRFSFPLTNKAEVVTILNGFVFTLSMTPQNTVDWEVNVKPDVPPILIPTLLLLRSVLFDPSTLWTKKSTSASTESTTSDSNAATQSAKKSSQVIIPPTSNEQEGALVKTKPWIETTTDLMFVLPFPLAGISKTLHDLPADYWDKVSSGERSPLTLFLTYKFVPLQEVRPKKKKAEAKGKSGKKSRDRYGEEDD